MNRDIISWDMGEVIVYALNDFSEMQAVAEFFPDLTQKELDRYSELYPGYFDGGIISAFDYCCYIIKDNDRIVLVDTGVGNPSRTNHDYAPQWRGRLIEHLLTINIARDEIDMVICTHLHADHTGWNAFTNDLGTHKTFPNAVYLASEMDFDAYENGITKPAIPESCFQANVRRLVESGEMKWIPGENYQIGEHVTLNHMPGHTPGLYNVIIRSGTRICVLSSDGFASPIQVTDPAIRFAYDIDADEAYMQRIRILRQYANCDWVLGACHFGPGRIENSKEGAWIWKPLR